MLAEGAHLVDLVAEYENGTVHDLLVGEQRVELGLRLAETIAIPHVDEEDDGVHRREVLLPHFAHLQVAAQVERGELDAAERELLGRRMECRHWLRQAVVFEHVKQRRLASVVQAEEHQLAALLIETCVCLRYVVVIVECCSSKPSGKSKSSRNSPKYERTLVSQSQRNIFLYCALSNLLTTTLFD